MGFQLLVPSSTVVLPDLFFEAGDEEALERLMRRECETPVPEACRDGMMARCPEVWSWSFFWFPLLMEEIWR